MHWRSYLVTSVSRDVRGCLRKRVSCIRIRT